MRKTMTIKILSAAMACLLLGATVACSHVPPVLQAKAAATYTVRDAGDALDLAYQTEKSFSGLVPVAVQNVVLDKFATAFDKVGQAAADLQKVQPGDAVPTSVQGAVDALKDVLAALNALTGVDVSKVVDYVNKALAVYEAVHGGDLTRAL